MLNTYIKNRGMTQTIIIDNNNNQINQLNWEADYDGDVANISIDTDTNGKSNHYDIKLDNNDLDNILNVESVNIPIHKRLKMDFDEPREPHFIKLPTHPQPIFEGPDTTTTEFIDRRVSSPKSNDYFVPLSIDTKRMKKYKLTPKKRHKPRKTHITYKLIKKPKSTSTRKRSLKTKYKTLRSISNSL